jgi:hypothetical protein
MASNFQVLTAVYCLHRVTQISYVLANTGGSLQLFFCLVEDSHTSKETWAERS